MFAELEEKKKKKKHASFSWQHGPKDRADPVSLWTAHIFVLSTATIVLFVLVTMVGMVSESCIERPAGRVISPRGVLVFATPTIVERSVRTV